MSKLSEIFAAYFNKLQIVNRCPFLQLNLLYFRTGLGRGDVCEKPSCPAMLIARLQKLREEFGLSM